MNFRLLINLFAWLTVLAVVIYAVLYGGSSIDQRTKVIEVSARSSERGIEVGGKMSGDYDTIDDKTIFQIEPESADEATERNSADPEAIALSDSAAFLMTLQDYTGAKRLLVRALQIDSTYARGWYNHGVASQNLNRYGNAIKSYETACQLRPHYYKPAYNLGVLYSRIGKNRKAQEWLSKAAELNQSRISAPAHYNLGIVYKRLGNSSGAETSYHEAIRLRPDYAEAHYNLAMILMDGQRHDEAIEELRKSISLGFTKPKAFKHLAFCYSETGNDSSAAASYQTAAVYDSTDAQTWFNLGVVFRRMNLPDSAVAAYRQALQIDTSIYEAHFNLALAYASIDQPEVALEHYRHATAINPSYTRAYYNAAHIYSELGQLDSSAVFYERVVELDPENSKAMFNLGLIYTKLERHAEAVRIYGRLVDQDPVNTKGLNNLGGAYRRMREYDSAFVYYDRLVGLTRSSSAYFNRAKVYDDLDSVAAAKRDYAVAIEQRSDYAKAYHNLGVLEKRTGNLYEAVRRLEKAVSLEPSNWKSHWILGQVYVKLGQLKEAREEYTIAALAKPESKRFWRLYEEIFEPTK